jgi:hypothetical protein
MKTNNIFSAVFVVALGLTSAACPTRLRPMNPDASTEGSGGAAGQSSKGGQAGADIGLGGGKGGISPGGQSGATSTGGAAGGVSGAGGAGGSGTGPTKAANGTSCTAGTECGSGFCAQGVCCNTACAESCYACTSKLTGSSPDGTCAVVSSGVTDPAGACTAGTTTSCGNSGSCDGNGACEKYGSSTVCKAASCGTSGFTSASTCDGKGNCVAGTATDCKGFTCSAATGCATTCASDADCPSGYCTGAKTCAATLSDGATCSANDQCTHGNCISGVCCATTCSGTCMTCATGICKPVASGGSSNGACTIGSAICGHDGTCDGNGGCRNAPSSVSCRAASCSGGIQTAAANCDGAGNCPTAVTKSCNQFVCGATACDMSCTGNSQCVSGAACVNGTCTACTSGETVCSNACANVLSDGANCGTCGHSCQGGQCSGGSCLPVTLATLPTGYMQGLAANSTTIFTTRPVAASTGVWSIFGVPKTGASTIPLPIYAITSTTSNQTGALVSTDSLVIFEPYYGGVGGKFSTIMSCNPSNCTSTVQTWYSSEAALNVCDPATQECFTQLQNGSLAPEVKYAILGTASQTTPTDFSPVLNIAYDGIGAAAGGYLYSTGLNNTTQQWPVLQRISEDGTSGVLTLANFNQTSGNNLFGPVVVTSTQVFMMAYDASMNIYGVTSVPLPNGVGNSAPAFLTKLSTSELLTYWADDNNIIFQSGALQWVSCPATGCVGTPKVLADASQAEPYLVGDAQAIYWINNVKDPSTATITATSLMKVAR